MGEVVHMCLAEERRVREGGKVSGRRTRIIINHIITYGRVIVMCMGVRASIKKNNQQKRIYGKLGMKWKLSRMQSNAYPKR